MIRLRKLLPAVLMTFILVPSLTLAKAEGGGKEKKEAKEESESKETKKESKKKDKESKEDAEKDPEALKHKIEFVELDPAFVTNVLSERMHYFRTDVVVKVRGEDTKDAIRTHAYAIRHNLVMLFSRQTEEDLHSLEGKKQLQADAASQIISVLEEEQSPSNVEDVLFTTFVVE